MNKPLLLLLGAAAIWAGGCTMIPRYARPAAPVPAAWPSVPAPAAGQPGGGAPAAASLPWRQFFPDPKLQQIIATALANNRDLRLAALTVERVRAMYRIQQAELLPVLDAGASYSRQRVPADAGGVESPPYTYSQREANLSISAWELDFFGRTRSLATSALQEYLATEHARNGAQILLVAATASAYLAVAADREALALAQTTLQSQQAAHRLVKDRCDRGITSELDLHRAQTQIDIARVDVARLTRQLAQDRNALELLAGGPVAADLLPATLARSAPLPEVASGLPSEVLLRRPDIMQAESLLLAANANIGAARATLFPRITLTSSIGSESSELSGLFHADSQSWSFVPRLSIPIFDPRSWSALKVTKVQKEAAVAQYEKAIQTAFREVADTLALLATANEQLAAQESLVQATAASYSLATARYDSGIDSYLSVLTAQQSMYAAQQQLVAMRLAKIAGQVKLYAVLGGGADPEPEAKPDAKGADGAKADAKAKPTAKVEAKAKAQASRP